MSYIQNTHNTLKCLANTPRLRLHTDARVRARTHTHTDARTDTHLRLKVEGHHPEEQAGFRAGRSTTEQVITLRILCEKYLQQQQDLYHVFIDFKTAFDRVWHAALWATMNKYNISANLNPSHQKPI